MKIKCATNILVNPSIAPLLIATGLLAASASLADTVYVSNSGDGTIMKFAGGVGSVFAAGLNNPEGLALDTAGNLYVAIQGNNTIVKFTPGGASSIFANTGLNGPEGIAFDSAGNLYAGNYFGHTIQRFTPGGVGSIFATGLTDPSGLAFDSAGNLYVADEWAPPTDGKVVKFTPDGVGSVLPSTPYSAPVYIAIQVPEPSANALLSLALPALLAFRRRT